jgi:hypothetical protein
MSENHTITLAELEKALADFDVGAYFAAKQARRERPWVRDIIAVLYPRPNGIRIERLVDALWGMREKSLPMPKEFGKTVQSCLNHHTSQSAVFIKNGTGPEDDLFYSPQGKGSGTWAVHRERAIFWLKRKGLPPT